jgi:Transposase DDE domain group 1
MPESAWVPAITQAGEEREGAAVCELTNLDLTAWPEGTRAICRRERPHPGAQLTFTDHQGFRFQVFITDQDDANLAQLEARHRGRARIEDRIRCGKDTGLRSFPFRQFAANQVWLELVLAAQDLLTFFQRLCLDGEARSWEPKTLRHRLLHVAGRVARHGRRVFLPPAALLALGLAARRRLPASSRPARHLSSRSDRCHPGHPGRRMLVIPPTSERFAAHDLQHRNRHLVSASTSSPSTATLPHNLFSVGSARLLNDRG